MNIKPVQNNINTSGKKSINNSHVKNQNGFQRCSDNGFGFVSSVAEQVRLPQYIPKDIKNNEVELVNKARQKIEHDWKHYISKNHPDIDETEFWRALSSGIAENNRHIPPPVDSQALNQIIGLIDKLPAQEFSDIYNSKLIEISLKNIQSEEKFKKTLLYDKNGILLDKTDKSNFDKQNIFWIKIPSQKKDFLNCYDNILNVEKLSSPNWCTRSKYDKAQDALKDGDFIIYVEKKKDIWTSKIAMTMYLGKIRQIQGSANDNLIPLQYISDVKNFLLKNNYISETKEGKIKNLGCSAGYTSEGPAAYTQLLISEFLANFDI